MPVTGVRAPTTVSGAAEGSDTVTVTLTRVDGGPVAGISVAASSDTPAEATVNRESVTDDAGDAIFLISYVATGTPVISFTTASNASIGTVGVTVS